jgi:hypothetical protein
MSKTKQPAAELLDQLLSHYQKPEDLIGADGILKQLTKKLVERALDSVYPIVYLARLHPHQGARRCCTGKSGVPSSRYQPRRRERNPRPVDRSERGRQVLVAGEYSGI